MENVIREIQKSVFDKIINKPFHVLYGTVAHIWDGQKDHYVITNRLELPIKPLDNSQSNELFERGE